MVPVTAETSMELPPDTINQNAARDRRVASRGALLEPAFPVIKMMSPLRLAGFKARDIWMPISIHPNFLRPEKRP